MTALYYNPQRLFSPYLVENMPRISYKDLKPAFREAERQQLQAFHREPGDRSPQPFTRFLATFETDERHYYLAVQGYNCLDFEGREAVDMDKLIVLWKSDQGTIQTEEIQLRRHTGFNGGVYYTFVCPDTGRTVRHLYVFGNGNLSSRHACEYLHYSSQYLKPSKDPFLRYQYLEEKNPARPMGKVEYRGSITPYGRRLEKYVQEIGKINFDEAYRKWLRRWLRRWDKKR